MTRLSKSAGIGIAALTLAGASLAFAASNSSASADELCRIEMRAKGAMTEFSAMVHADAHLSGEYRFEVSGSGTNLKQSGTFVAEAGKPQQLGYFALGGDAKAYTVQFTLKANGQTYDCSSLI